MVRRRTGSREPIWRERLRRFPRSGLTVARFCDEEGVSVASYYAWRRRLCESTTRRDSQFTLQDSPEPALFVPLSTAPVVGDLRIDVADGVVIRLPLVTEERLLRTCLRAALAVIRPREGD